MKKNYIKPEMRVVKLQNRNRLLVGSDPYSVTNSPKSVYRGGEETLGDDDLDQIF
jgi:hypothetical protein